MPSPLSGRIRVHIWDFGATVATEFDRIGVPVQCLYESIWLTYLLTLYYWNVDVVYRYCHIMALGIVISWSASCISALSNHPSRTWSGFFPNPCVMARERSRGWRKLSGLWRGRVGGAVTLRVFLESGVPLHCLARGRRPESVLFSLSPQHTQVSFVYTLAFSKDGPRFSFS